MGWHWHQVNFTQLDNRGSGRFLKRGNYNQQDLENILNSESRSGWLNVIWFKWVEIVTKYILLNLTTEAVDVFLKRGNYNQQDFWSWKYFEALHQGQDDRSESDLNGLRLFEGRMINWKQLRLVDEKNAAVMEPAEGGKWSVWRDV